MSLRCLGLLETFTNEKMEKMEIFIIKFLNGCSVGRVRDLDPFTKGSFRI